MKTMLTTGRIVKGYTVAIEFNSKYGYRVNTIGDNYHVSKGGFKTLEQAKEYYRKEIEFIQG